MEKIILNVIIGIVQLLCTLSLCFMWFHIGKISVMKFKHDFYYTELSLKDKVHADTLIWMVLEDKENIEALWKMAQRILKKERKLKKCVKE